MATWQATALALNPIFFGRTDDLSGSVFTDTSVELHHGSYFPGVVFGIASPIETDPASTAVRGAVATIPAPASSTWDLKNAFSWGVFGYYDTDQMLSLTAHLLNRRGQFGLTHGVQVGFNGGNIQADITLDNGGIGDYFPLSVPVPVDKRWYFIVVTRDGNVMRLYVNGVLAAQRTDLTTAEVDYNVDGNPWYVGRSINTTAFSSVGLDELLLFDYALNAGQVLTLWESAINTLNSSATITVRVTVTLDTDAPEPIDFAFSHNWADPISGSERVITEHLSWKTLSNRSEPDYHQRIGARSYGPLRALECAITPTTARARAALQRSLWQPAQFYKLPISTDWVELTAQADASDVTLDCDTTLRDFEIGGYVTAWRDVRNPSSSQTFRITSVSDTQLGVSPAVATTFPLGSQLMPARLACLPDESSSFDSYTIDRETGALRFEILSTELSTRRVTTYVPATTHESIEVFALDSARFDILEPAQYQIQRRQLGTGLLTGNDYYRMVDTLAPVTIPVRVLLVSRETLSEFYGWLEARQGRRNPVWVSSVDNDLELVANLGGTIKTIGYSTYNLHYGRRHIQITYTDGTVTNHKITAMVNNGDGTETLTLSGGLGASAITKISLLRLCVAPDSFELRFHRDLAVAGGMAVECAWEFTELLTTP